MVTKAFSVEDGNLGNRALVTTRNRLYKDIDLTLEMRSTGDVYKKQDAAAVKQAVRNLLLTNYGEKPFQPRYGANLAGLLFDLADDLTASDIEVAIRNAIGTYEPRATVQTVRADVNPDRNTVTVEVVFQIQNTEEVVSVQTTIARLR